MHGSFSPLAGPFISYFPTPASPLYSLPCSFSFVLVTCGSHSPASCAMLAFNDWWATPRQAHLLPNPLGAWDFRAPLNPGEIPVRPTSTRARDLAVTLCAPPLTANRGPLPSHAASRSRGTGALTCGTLGAAEAWTGHCSSPTSRSDSLLPTRSAETARAPANRLRNKLHY